MNKVGRILRIIKIQGVDKMLKKENKEFRVNS